MRVIKCYGIKQNLHNKKIIEDLKSQSENNKETITHKNFI